jgi:hypothetical protein
MTAVLWLLVDLEARKQRFDLERGQVAPLCPVEKNSRLLVIDKKTPYSGEKLSQFRV